MEYIDACLGEPLKLADVAAAADVSVRTLQHACKHQLGTTPLGFIIEMSLQRVEADLSCSANADQSIADVVRRWGFVHVSDFTPRYRQALRLHTVENTLTMILATCLQPIDVTISAMRSCHYRNNAVVYRLCDETYQ